MKEKHMKYINFYANGSSDNHGCEAIIRSTIKIVKDRYNCRIYSNNLSKDLQYKLNEIGDLRKGTINLFSKKRTIETVIYNLFLNVFKNRSKAYKYYFSPMANEIVKNEVYVSIGGDNYCYSNSYILNQANKLILNKDAKIVLWGCSIEASALENDCELREEIRKFALITARETYSYEAIKKVNPNTILTRDTAFILDKTSVELPYGFDEGNTIGVNLSPLVEEIKTDSKYTIFDNYKHTIDWILQNTDHKVALIPHVEGDMVSLKKLYLEFENSNRIILCENNYNCQELKYIISKCMAFICARTHASVAAYSSSVPTLVSGYSIKARGIAKDLFGTEKDYVVPIQNMQSNDELTNAFIKIYENRGEIRDHLNNILPEYIKNIDYAEKKLIEIVEGKDVESQ